jgi:hypothetical protein
MGDTQLPNLGGIDGVSFFTNSGSIGIGLSSGGGGLVTLTLGAGGTLSGNLTQNDPVAFAFSLNPSGGTVTAWNLTMAFGDAFGFQSYGAFDTSGSGLSGSTLVIPTNVPSGSTFLRPQASRSLHPSG